MKMAEQFTPGVQAKEPAPVSALAPEQAISLVPEAQSTMLVEASEQILRAAPSTVVPERLAMLDTVSVVDTLNITGSEDETNCPVSRYDEIGDSDDRLKVRSCIEERVGGCNAVGTNSNANDVVEMLSGIYKGVNSADSSTYIFGTDALMQSILERGTKSMKEPKQWNQRPRPALNPS